MIFCKVDLTIVRKKKIIKFYVERLSNKFLIERKKEKCKEIFIVTLNNIPTKNVDVRTEK